MLLFATFLGGVLVQSYFLWARIWFGYAAEQSLYCLAENRPAQECGGRFRRQSGRALPIGHLSGLNFYPGEGQWRLRFEWTCANYRLAGQRALNLKDLESARGVLR